MHMTMHQRSFLDPYEFIMLLDDDIQIQPNDITKLFLSAQSHHLDLLQASLSHDSYCGHPVCYNQGSEGLRFTSAVDIMMPIFSREALNLASKVMKRGVSGWGVDLAIGELVVDRNDGVAAVSDEVVAEHRKEIDRERGAFYTMLKNEGIYPEVELTYLQKLYNFSRSIIQL
jgi:hypothetical protein